MSSKVHFLKAASTITPERRKAQAIQIGFIGTADEVENLVQECRYAYDASPETGYQQAISSIDGLMKGAYIALNDGRPGNLQTLLECNTRHPVGEDHIQFAIINTMLNDRSLSAAAIRQVTATLPEPERKDFLTTAMNCAVSSSQHSAVRTLLYAGARADTEHQYFLRTAARHGDTKMMTILCEEGANPQEAADVALQEKDTRAYTALKAYLGEAQPAANKKAPARGRGLF